MWRVGGQEVEPDAAPGALQPGPQHFGVMVSGIVQENMDQPLVPIGAL